MLIIILSVVGLICLYLAIDHAISDVYQYKYMEKIVNMLRDEDTRQLFVYLRPYMVDYIHLMRKQTEYYARDVNGARIFREFYKVVHKDKIPEFRSKHNK